MVTAKPDDKKEPARVHRSGHGAASVIPHLRGDPALAPEAGDAASAQEPKAVRPQDGTAQPPQAE